MSTKIPLIAFMVVNYPWAWALPWGVADKPNETPLKKTDFLSACRYHLQISSWIGVRAHAHFPLSVLRPHLVWSCAGLTHVLIISGCAYVHLPLVSGKHCLFEDIHHLWLLNFTASYFSWILERRRLMKILCLVLVFQSLSPLYIVQLKVAVLIPIYDVGLVRHCSMGIEIHH